MAVTGGCRCGAIRYRAEGAPAHSALCHCRDCRRSAGAPLVGWALFPRDAVAVEGRPTDYESSPGVVRRFCGRCGTGLFYVNEGLFPGQVDIQTGSLDEPDALPPTTRIQTLDAPAWFAGFSDLPAFERFPG